MLRIILVITLVVFAGVARAAYAPFPAPSTPTRILSTGLSTIATSIKGSSGVVFSIIAVNTTETIVYLKFYDTASAPVCNSTAVGVTLPIPSSSAGGILAPPLPVGINFVNGIGVCLTTNGNDNDNTIPASGVFVTILWN